MQALKEIGATQKEATVALEYYLHPAVADPSVQQAVTSVKVASAPTMYGEKKSLEILADSLSEDAVNAVAPVSSFFKLRRVKEYVNIVCRNSCKWVQLPCSEWGTLKWSGSS